MTDDPIADAEPPGDAADGPDVTASDDHRADVRAAVAQVRREGYKAAFVYASVDAVAVLLAANLLGGLLGVARLEAAVAPGTLGSLGLPAPSGTTVLAVAAGLLAFGVEFAARVRQPLVERFEAANPGVAEALRTARDAARTDRADPMAQALYAEVLDRLRGSSSVGLLSTPRLAATVVVALLLAVASVQASLVGFDLGGVPEPTGGQVSASGGDPADLNDTELQDGDGILGEETNVSAGDENLTADVGAEPGGEGDREWNYERDGSGGDGGVEARRAGFAPTERVEDAGLVRRYARELGGNVTDG